MVKCSPTLGTLVSTKTKCIKLIFTGKLTLVPVAFLMALSILNVLGILRPLKQSVYSKEYLEILFTLCTFSLVSSEGRDELPQA